MRRKEVVLVVVVGGGVVGRDGVTNLSSQVKPR